MAYKSSMSPIWHHVCIERAHSRAEFLIRRPCTISGTTLAVSSRRRLLRMCWHGESHSVQYSLLIVVRYVRRTLSPRYDGCLFCPPSRPEPNQIEASKLPRANGMLFPRLFISLNAAWEELAPLPPLARWRRSVKDGCPGY
jgi:hypothetical protein